MTSVVETAVPARFEMATDYIGTRNLVENMMSRREEVNSTAAQAIQPELEAGGRDNKCLHLPQVLVEVVGSRV